MNSAVKMARSLKLALIQMEVSAIKADNLMRAMNLVAEAKKQNADVVVLPECFNSPYGTKHFEPNAEEVPSGPSCIALSDCAKAKQVHLIGGSIPERLTENGIAKLYNTSTVWSPEGNLIAKHQKTHLFDIDIPGKITFKESETLSPGKGLTTFNIAAWKVGLGICYDLRFNEMATIYRKLGCSLLLYPGAFNMTTGPLHWELLIRARAVDTQCFVAGIAPARTKGAGYQSYGNTMLVDPWGKILCRADADEEIVYADIDLSTAEEFRQNIPVYSQRRTDLYDTIEK
ncbi:omega-amidase NIT2 [Neocloeon triangulifer]|uniref:omega-amidase NIT2 n=1 Tax=Neocloeon triangulifer TaxID=2078957 RepID=UPI00286F5966|nr:omega-amidase NIT2 [Neocloeon triangulifer]